MTTIEELEAEVTKARNEVACMGALVEVALENVERKARRAELSGQAERARGYRDASREVRRTVMEATDEEGDRVVAKLGGRRVVVPK